MEESSADVGAPPDQPPAQVTKRDPWGEFWPIIVTTTQLTHPELFVDFPDFGDDVVTWHYTSAAGLVGILKTNELWASGLYQLNDPAEGEYGHTVLQRVWDDMREGVEDEGTIEMIDLILSMQSISATQDSIHVFSASLAKDALSLWQYYGADDGYAVGMSAGAVSRLEIQSPASLPESLGYRQRWWVMPVIYEPVQQHAIAEALIRAFIAQQPDPLRWEADYSGIDWSASPLPTTKELRERLVRLIWADERTLWVRLFAAFAKDPAFAHEREVRFIADRVSPSERDYRAIGGRIVPFIRLASPQRDRLGAPLPVDQILCGPTTPLDTERAVRSMLETFGHTAATVERSPIRFRK